ncbi:MAG: hypothetical protein EPN82_09180 [Bacteroidetes bacterium]|nr:MAG: hypothetical protein EPN82_09180 [Bacteroidota bacterium]
MTVNNKKLYISIIILLAIGLIYLFLGSNYKLNIYDEAIGIYGAKRVAQGDIPYRDFWTLYAPGYFYILAFLLNIAGWTIFNERLFSIAFMLLPPVIAFLIAKKYLKINYSYLVFIFIVIWTGYCSFYGKSVPLALGMGILSLLFVIKFIETKKTLNLIISGIITGLTAYFRIEFGAYIFISVIISIFIYFHLIKDLKEYKISFYLLLKYLFFYILIIVIALLPAVIYFLVNVSFRDLYQQLIYAPSEIYPRFRTLQLPMPFLIATDMTGYSQTRIIELFVDSIVFYIPLVVYFITFWKLISIVLGKRINENTNVFFIKLILLLSGLIFYSQASVRSEKEHLFSTMAIALILIVFLFFESKFKWQKFIYIITITLTLSMPVENRLKMIYKSYISKNTYWYKSHELKYICDVRSKADNFEKAVNYLKFSIPQNEKIFVGNYSHDRILLNDLMFYFLSGKDACTKYHELHPGIATTHKVQKEIINDLQKNNVNYLVLCENNEFTEQNESSISSGVFVLDNFIHDNYALYKQFGTNQIWKKKY